MEELADTLSGTFGVETKNCFSAYIDIKRRRDNSCTYFLDKLWQKFNERMKQGDLKGGKFKKR